jgi:hypothetical protein
MQFESSTMNVMEELRLFETPPVDVSLEKSHFVEYTPIHVLTDTRPVDFEIIGRENEYIDLKRSLIKVTFKLEQVDGTAAPVDADVCIINNITNALWQRDDIFLNKTLVSPSSNNYPYKSYIDIVLNYSPQSNNERTAGLWYKDTTSNIFDTMNATKIPGAAGQENFGLNSRYEYVKESKTVVALSPLSSDLCSLDKWILPGVQIDIRLWQSAQKFRIMQDPLVLETYKISLKDCVFLAKTITVAPEVRLGHERMLQSGMRAKYPFKRSRVLADNIPLGSTFFQKDQIFQDERPCKIIFGLTEATGYVGDLTKNPYNFTNTNFAPETIDVTFDDKSINGRIYRVDSWNNGDFTELFYNMHAFSGNADLEEFKNSGSIAFDNFKDGYCFFVFEEYAGLQLPENTVPEVRKGNTKINLKFSGPTAADATIIIYGVFHDVFEIDAQRRIHLTK